MCGCGRRQTFLPLLSLQNATPAVPDLDVPRCCCSRRSLSRACLRARPFTRILILALRLRFSLALSPLSNDMSSPLLMTPDSSPRTRELVAEGTTPFIPHEL